MASDNVYAIGEITYETAATGSPNLPFKDALELVHLCAERGSPNERAALR